jgi:hypothetical protein
VGFDAEVGRSDDLAGVIDASYLIVAVQIEWKACVSAVVVNETLGRTKIYPDDLAGVVDPGGIIGVGTEGSTEDIECAIAVNESVDAAAADVLPCDLARIVDAIWLRDPGGIKRGVGPVAL